MIRVPKLHIAYHPSSIPSPLFLNWGDFQRRSRRIAFCKGDSPPQQSGYAAIGLAGRRNRWSPCKLVNMIITNDLVEAFLKCPTKCFLRSGGEAGTGNAYAAWVRTKNDVFRIEGTKRLVAEVASDKCDIGTQAMESLKPAQWTWAWISLYRVRTCNVPVTQ